MSSGPFENVVNKNECCAERSAFNSVPDQGSELNQGCAGLNQGSAAQILGSLSKLTWQRSSGKFLFKFRVMDVKGRLNSLGLESF